MTETTTRAGRREWLGLGLLTLPLFVLAIDVSALFLAAPHIGADLAPSATQWLWILDIYGFMIAGFLVTMGSIGDRIGRRRLLLVGSAAFALASALAAFAQEPVVLIAARAVLGVAGATLMPSTLALIRTMFRDDAQRATAISVWMTTFSVGVALGALFGGALLQLFWWGSVFLAAVPVMLLVLVLGPRLLPESRDPSAGGTDWASVALSVAGIIAVVQGLKELAAEGITAGALLALGAGAALATVFVRRQRRLAQPLIDLTLFSRRAFSTALALLTAGIFAATAVNFLIPQYLQLVAGHSPLRAGLFTTPLALAAMAGSLTAPWLAARFGTARLIAAGTAVSVAGYLVLSQVGTTGSLGTLLVGACLAVFGMCPMTVLTTHLVVASAPEHKAGSAAALSETSGELGVALGIAVTGSVVTAVYRADIGGRLPADTPAGTVEAASDSITAAQNSVAQLPAELAEGVIRAANEAFTHGLNVVGYLSAAVSAVLIALALIGLREDAARPRTQDADA
ncbi:MFS transporter [Streptomyces sp. XM4011]|uniref:MFS transporter n=1 Tax=Streptomyces sp. XM4011 TaxID=2929780 RepID=UPI001FF74159|nr:MFS transporter [Streptomyces sp. XM4011]MCK1813579.1 MFS transporter [Streptomyces sp. XM4011]